MPAMAKVVMDDCTMVMLYDREESQVRDRPWIANEMTKVGVNTIKKFLGAPQRPSYLSWLPERQTWKRVKVIVVCDKVRETEFFHDGSRHGIICE
jgi:hypothetical protein